MKFNEQQVDTVTELLKSIAHPIRMKILCFLMEGEKNVGEIEQQFGSTISNISQHLTVLRKANIIDRRKEANFMFYSIKDNNILKLMETLKNNFC
ncbi:MAG TPA: metalloregulator ArsR/SmtB family transcription factor [Spirochaetota bacterium]|nr:metalloregulator ArsR/SmtB family transcription factor [Spirochaetota bacterium]HPC42071.1 metalloregulator ArsR/SmtB family transcription factor [Spirochaetota bacterium]HPL15991.1 metalloregulator ArsR/SmtB family transcription factor [Spirochaetota bacterium]HQF09025.1 metalloregulator ArsR/SmtB family transcription factor [Spirochaetota bacterium]HQH97913.1 metalloregulator ArsR/SmtB family transcription factor [Spirochaetota bacterium]